MTCCKSTWVTGRRPHGQSLAFFFVFLRFFYPLNNVDDKHVFVQGKDGIYVDIESLSINLSEYD